MSIEISELDQMQHDYKAAVDEWVNAIRAEEALATNDESMVAMEKWDAPVCTSTTPNSPQKRPATSTKTNYAKRTTASETPGRLLCPETKVGWPILCCLIVKGGLSSKRDRLSLNPPLLPRPTYFARGCVSSYTFCTCPTVNCVYRCVVDSRSCPSIS